MIFEELFNQKLIVTSVEVLTKNNVNIEKLYSAIENYEETASEKVDFRYLFGKLLIEYKYNFFDKATITADKLIGLIERNKEYAGKLFVNAHFNEKRNKPQKVKLRVATYLMKAKLLVIEKDFKMAQMYVDRANYIQNSI